MDSKGRMSLLLNGWEDSAKIYNNIWEWTPIAGQTLLKIHFVTKAWPDIRRKLEKTEEWQEKELNELLREVQKVYVRRDEEQMKAKAKIMVATT